MGMNTVTAAEPAVIPTGERNALRELAKRVAEIAHQPEQAEKVDLWRCHNQLERRRPMILVFPEGSWRELWSHEAPFRSTTPRTQVLERTLRQRLYYAEHLEDDNVIEDIISSPIVIRNSEWGLVENKIDPAENTGAGHFEPVLVTEADADKLGIPEMTIDWEETDRLYDQTQELLGDILSVEKEGRSRGSLCPLDHYAKLRGIDRMFMDLVDNPEFVHRVIGHITDANIHMMKSLERQGGLTIGNRRHYTGSGGTAYTDELPQADFDGVHVRTRDLWGFATAQIFSEVSPAMHEEFALQHEKRFLDLFGLNSYGCCEALHHKMDLVIKHVPRLRRISISPWADINRCSEQLGKDYIYSWKPNPAILASETWDPERVRNELRDFCERTRGNVVEIIMKDTHTVRNEPRRMWEWVQIAKEVAAEY